MSREWKPGDVALVGGERVIRAEFGCDTAFIDGIGRYWRNEDETARPLVVINPGEPGEIDRLREALIYSGWLPSGDADALDDILREFANPKPPKPDEPMGLGAVVETVHGELYVRDKTTTTVAHWKRAKGEESGKRHRYANLDVVRVHSQGWEPDK